MVIAKSPRGPLTLSMAIPQIALPALDDGGFATLIIVAINSLRFSFRPAGGAGGDYESYGQSGSGKNL
ncbi:MAG TPA: hypothetical protein VIM99_18275 [Blastocatellia bacterium]